MPAAPAVPDLLADVGGTTARLALARGGRLLIKRRLAVADFPGPAAAVDAFLADAGIARGPKRVAIAWAGPVAKGRAELSNAGWRISARDLSHHLKGARVHLVNDFSAVAWALPRLRGGDLVKIGGGRSVPEAPRVVLGPGTGLGMAGLVAARGGPVVVPTEGGHVTMPAADAREAAIIDYLRTRSGHVSAERILSGPGLEHLYGAIAALDRVDAPPRTAAEIATHALDGTCQASGTALAAFCRMLGTVAGNAALSFGALGGVYIAGGIVPRFPDYLKTSEFRERFEEKGRFVDYMRAIPTWVIVRPDPAFVGLANLLRHSAA
jgi:glucokinase